jgi:hypothetical protein
MEIVMKKFSGIITVLIAVAAVSLLSGIDTAAEEEVMQAAEIVEIVDVSGAPMSAGVAVSEVSEEGVVGGIEMDKAVEVTAIVVGIDKKTRTLTLQGAEGEVVELVCGDEVRNFAQIEMGDELTAQYMESEVIYMGAPGEEPEADAGVVVGRAELGEKPAGYMVGTVDVSATIENVHAVTRKVTLRFPDGSKKTTKIDPAVAPFEDLKIGETFHVRMTKALAVSVK